MSVILDDLSPDKSVCPNCAEIFPYRSNKTFCSPKCRKAHHKWEIREYRKGQYTSQTTWDEQRNRLEEYHLNLVLSEKLYGLPPAKRPGYVEEILQIARNEEQGLLRRLLGNKKFIRPDPSRKKMFYRRMPQSYLTFPQACNRYLLTSPMRCSLVNFLKGAPEPPTGEVFPDGTVDDGEGWKAPLPGIRGKGGKLKVIRGRVQDPLGLYIHPWYFDHDDFSDQKKASLHI